MKDDPFFLEEHFHGKDRKKYRKERKLARSTDRSKYKKTDADKRPQREAPQDPSLKKGRVLSISGEGIVVSYDEQKYLCNLRGTLKKEKTRDKNLIAVGDFVLFHAEEKAITYVQERTSFLSRSDVSGRKQQLIAVNIDQVLITVSLVSPHLKPFLIDRYIIAARKGFMAPVIVINKIDLLDDLYFSEEARETDRFMYKEFLSAYEPLGYPILSVSVNKEIGLNALKEMMKNKASVFSGQSGVGKSSLINSVLKTTLAVGEVRKRYHKGAHTTTMAELIPLEKGGFCIDTPGIRSFGIWNLTREDITEHFTEFQQFREKCKYPDCIHLDEPECAVQDAVEKKLISALRFESYRCLIVEESE